MAMRRPFLKRYALLSVLALAEFLLLPRWILPIGERIPSDVYNVLVEPWQPILFFTLTLGLLMRSLVKTAPSPSRKKAHRGFLALHFSFLAAALVYLFWLTRIYPFQPLDPESLWVQMARSINPVAGAFMFRYRIVVFLLFIGAQLSLLEAFFRPSKALRKRYVLAFLAGILFGEYFFTRIASHLFWQYTHGAVTAGVYALIWVFFRDCSILSVTKAGLPWVGTCKFNVAIASECSGLEGIFLFLLVAATAFWMDRKKLVYWKAALFAFLGAAAMFLVNILRIFALIGVGHFYDADFAINTWHSYSGIFFYALAIFILFKLMYLKTLRK